MRKPVLMNITRRDAVVALIISLIEIPSIIGGCYAWRLVNYSSSPQAIIDTSQGGETIVRYVDGRPMELVFNPEKKPKQSAKK